MSMTGYANESKQMDCNKRRWDAFRAASDGASAAQGVNMPLSSERPPLPPHTAVARARRGATALLAAVPLLVALGSAPAHAVCEELSLQFFSGYMKLLESASQPCKEFIRLNVDNYAYRTTLVEVCRNKRNLSGRFRNEIYKQANKCIDKKSVGWIRGQYAATAAEQLRNWRGLVAANPDYCKQQVVREYIDASEQILQQTREQAKQYCSN